MESDSGTSTQTEANMPEMALAHVLDSVLKVPNESAARSAFPYFGIITIYDLMSVNAQEDLHEYFLHSTIDSDGDTTDLKHLFPTMLIRYIILLQNWYLQQHQNNIGIWFDLTSEAFIAWQHKSRLESSQRSAATTATATGTQNIPTKTMTDAASFQRSFKRSPTDYNKFKDDNRWKQWHRHLKATANSQGLANVLNTSYNPTTAEAIDLFNLQNTYMYSVFEQCLNTAESCHVVQLHDASSKAQLVYAGLLATYEEDLTTSLEATDLRSELTLLRFDDQWKKSINLFLQH
jgi:hypothetical protein